MVKMNDDPARRDLTLRECTKLLGAVIGGLLQLSELETVRDAVRWWAEKDEAWEIAGMLKLEEEP